MITRIVLTALLTAGLAACAGETDEPGGTHVVAGFYPLAFAAEQIRGVDVEVTNLTPAGAEPHDLELTPREVEEILGADLVLYLGEGFQPAVEDAIKSGDAPALDALEGLELRDEGGVDPHVWLDPSLFARVVDRIAVELGDGTGGRLLVMRLNALDEAFRAGLADCDRRELVTSHDAFGYLADRYGLEVIAITGLSPEVEPSPQDLETVAELVQERGVTTVFTETLLSPEIGETVAREAGATTAVLNPLEGLTEEELDRGEDYFTVMQANLEALRAGLGCR